MSLFDFFRSPNRDNAKTETWQFERWQVRVIRSPRRRTLSLELKAHQPITVRTNRRTSRHEIEKILRQKHAWLEKNIEKLNGLPKLKPFHLRNGEEIYFLGKKYAIKRSVTTLKSPFLIFAEDKIQFLLPKNLFHEELPQALVHQILKQFYVRQARKYLPEQLKKLSLRTGLRPERLRIGFMRSRWGSCSSKSRISLNAKIMAAPEWVIDSVIVHELCHLRHMNHSKAYWQLANAHFDRHDEADQWLHQNLN